MNPPGWLLLCFFTAHLLLFFALCEHCAIILVPTYFNVIATSIKAHPFFWTVFSLMLLICFNTFQLAYILSLVQEILYEFLIVFNFFGINLCHTHRSLFYFVPENYLSVLSWSSLSFSCKEVYCNTFLLSLYNYDHIQVLVWIIHELIVASIAAIYLKIGINNTIVSDTQVSEQETYWLILMVYHEPNSWVIRVSIQLAWCDIYNANNVQFHAAEWIGGEHGIKYYNTQHNRFRY